MNHLYPTTGIPTHAIHPFTRLPWEGEGVRLTPSRLRGIGKNVNHPPCARAPRRVPPSPAA